MAKITLPPHMLRGLTGSHSGFKYQTKRRGTSQVSLSHPHQKRRRRQFAQVPPGLLAADPTLQPRGPQVPYLEDFPCLAFKIADAFYTAYHIWIQANQPRHDLPHRLTHYTLWMRQAIAHLIRSQTRSVWPYFSGKRAVTQLEYRARETHPYDPPDKFCEMPAHRRLHGLHYIAFRVARTYYEGPDPEPQPPPPPDVKIYLDYETRWCIESYRVDNQGFMYWAPPPAENTALGYRMIELFRAPFTGQAAISIAWQRIISTYPWPIWTLWEPKWFRVHYAPPKCTYIQGAPHYEADYTKIVPVWWLTTKNELRSWPQWFPSQRGSHRDDVEPWQATVQRKTYESPWGPLNPDLIHYEPL